LDSLHDRAGRVALRGFYSSVKPISPATRAVLRRLGPSDADFREAAGGAILSGDPTWTAFERTTLRPAVVITGVDAGGLGDEGRNSIPRSAHARLNLRLVPAQDPIGEARRVAAHIRHFVPPGLSVRMRVQAATPPTLADTDHPATAQVAAALEDTYGHTVVCLPSGGTIPAVGILQRVLETPVVLMGFSQPDDSVHGVNESFSIAGLWRATDACVRIYQHLGLLRTGRPRPVTALNRTQLMPDDDP
jgi:acetylornithine deacetylase/succinyl-diaminopimelate desuccinylase-like protein